MPTVLSTEQFIDHLRKIAKPQKVWANAHNISESYFSDVLNGRRDPGDKILDAIGFEKVVTYRKKAKAL